MTSQELILMQSLIKDKFGILLAEEKVHALHGKLGKILSKSSLRSLEELYTQVSYRNDDELIDDIIDAITVNETFWFRDRTPWLIMEEILLPTYITEIREGKRSIVSIWSGACSYGQEPYSIAMCIDRYLKSHDIHDLDLSHFEILATDLSRTVLDRAQMGAYDNISIQRGLDEVNRLEYFKNDGKYWRINDEIRNAVKFHQLNLVKEFFPRNKYDIIFFRNVLIYFSDEQKIEMMGKIKDTLKPGGTLFIGSSELFADHKPSFSMEQHKNGIYFRAENGCK